MDTEAPILNGENFRNKQTYGFKEIVLRQVQRITNIYSQELTKGFMKYSQPNQFGQQEPVAYISDGRKGYIQSVECLYDLLLPKFDDEIEKETEEDVEKEELNTKVKRMRKLFNKLCLLLERLDWLDEGGLED